MAPGGEDELVRRIHRAVGGPSKLSTYDDPGAVRRVVLDALAEAQRKPADARRVACGDLTPAERRVVRTVTNRGAAVRSRMRQRRELARLRDELRAKDARLARLEAALRALAASAGLSALPRAALSPLSPPHSPAMPPPLPPPHPPPDTECDKDLGNIIDQLIEPIY